MNSFFIKIPKWVPFLFKNSIWSIKTNQKELYLTFDDGPTPEITEWVLAQLDKYQAKATFFCIGKNIQAHPEIFKKLLKAGHNIGNHTQNHANGWKTKTATYLNNIKTAEKVLSDYKLPNSKKLFRPPYGKIKSSQINKIKEANYEIIMWSVLSADFDQKTSKKKCTQNVLNNSKNGAIIVFHDSLKAAENLKYTLPKILDFYNKKGYKFKAIN